MTLQEAIKSGKPFKRPTFRMGNYNDEPYLVTRSPLSYSDIVFKGTGKLWNPKADDVLANDWEVEPDPLYAWIFKDENGSIVGAVEAKTSGIPILPKGWKKYYVTETCEPPPF